MLGIAIFNNTYIWKFCDDGFAEPYDLQFFHFLFYNFSYTQYTQKHIHNIHTIIYTKCVCVYCVTHFV